MSKKISRRYSSLPQQLSEWLINEANISDKNREQFLPQTQNTKFQYDHLGQLVAATNQHSHINLEYDELGQLLSETTTHDGQTYSVSYVYDALGRRVSKQKIDKAARDNQDMQQIRFVWDGAKLRQEWNSKRNFTYIYKDAESFVPTAQISREANKETMQLNYLHTDQIGIPKEMTDETGELIWIGEYQACGKLDKENNIHQAHQPFRLQNQYFDNETGLHYNLFRYYEPENGKFVNQDPIRLSGGNNLYQFAPNPIRWVDWLGLSYFNHRVGDAGEKMVQNYLKNLKDSKGNNQYTEVFSVQNASNHGIDAIGKCAEKDCYRAFEVKTSFNGTPGKLSARQEIAGDFLKDILTCPTKVVH